MEGKLVKSLSFNKKVETKGLLSKIGNPFGTRSTPNTPTATPNASYDELYVATNQEQLYAEIKDVKRALDYFLNSSITEAEAVLRPYYKQSMYYALGHSFILFLKCVMTFQEEDIVTALNMLKHTIELASQQRKKDSHWINSVTNWVKGTSLEDIKAMTVVERHAELVHAEAYLLKALLGILHDESVMSFLRESLNIRSSYNTYMILEKYVNEADQPLDEHFTSGVALGVGCFSLILSMLPASVIKVAEFVGFSSDRDHGLQVLESASRDEDQHGLRRPLCDMVLISYHIVLSQMIPLSKVNGPFAESVLHRCLKDYPRGVFFLYFNGRLMVSKRLLDEAEEQYQKAIETQKDWKQLHHMCFWELGPIYMMRQQWQKAFDIYTGLQKESNWSKAVYSYLKAVSLYMLGKDFEEVSERMEKITGEKQKIAGKSIPMEKFVARKARKFTLQHNRLMLPDLEILSAFTMFGFIPKTVLENNLKRIDTELNKLDKANTYYYDDICLAHFLRASTARMLYEITKDQEMHKIHEQSLQIVFDEANKVVLDHYVYYFSRYEKAQMLILDKEYAKAEAELQIVLKANDKNHYGVGAGPHAKNKYSLSNALVFKCHNCMTKIKDQK
ncbi:uncharacterized protein B0P05DRAFT_518625 [Gilbertella persicaria]|uniref:uncharacterized protein n=1 Tax=Gilbertella persicaria TaxID=101096 RepID=UPI00221EA768|nr:uncharacterized protein B0P05DRAFT_518625 [Gilbertella persicaria]KAI8051415.1 hypothetical protein B0P05DRAFT_518625 [Gilbertella persicaria]